uniref:Ribosomal protein S4 n=1 Tax=Closterium baillyanum TaxID=1416941 RepID=U5YEX0_9VIRI|nr:ribosomal protein S4 [Closterium baillyanum]AGZ90262.1 ribosomal protein S4 [Closterium baillyanum]
MAYSKFKVCRRIKENIWQTKKLTPKQNTLISRLKKNTNRKQSDFSIRLQHMKKLSLFYGLRAAEQLDNLTYSYLDKQKSLLLNLETRLDVILVRINFCSTIFTARQLIAHQFICVNFHVVAIASATLGAGDILSVKPSHLDYVRSLIRLNQQNNRIANATYHLEVNYKTLNAVLLYEPSQIHFPYKIELDLLF